MNEDLSLAIKTRLQFFAYLGLFIFLKKLTAKRNHKDPALISISQWLVVILILFSIPSLAQDKQPINNKGKIKQMRAKSVKKKEKASTKDIAGKRLRTKNTNSVAGRAVYSNPSPYANERRGKDRAAKPIGGQPLRIRSRTAQSARNNVYPQRGPFVNQGPKRKNSRSNVYPQKGPFVNRSPRQTEKPAAKIRTRTGRLSTSARITKTYGSRTPRSASQSAETSKGRRFIQGGAFVNQSSRRTENVAGKNRYSRKTQLSAGPKPPGKKRTVTPRSATQQYVTKGKKNVYWGKFSKGEKAFTTDISGNPLRRKNYSTPPSERVSPKDPYAGRKRSSGDRAYSGTFRSGHVSGSKRGEIAWNGDVSGQPIRKRASKQTEIEGTRLSKGRGGSISASGKYRSNKSLGQNGGGSISGSGKFRSNQPLKEGAVSISASGKYRSNKPFGGRIVPLSVSGKSKKFTTKPRPGGGGSMSGKRWNNNNQPIEVRTPGIGASGMARIQKKPNSKQPIKVFSSDREARFQGNIKTSKPEKGGGSVSGRIWNNNNRPIEVRSPGIGASGMARIQKKPNSKEPIKIFNSDLEASFQGFTKTKEPKKGGGSISGKVWNNGGKPIDVRIPTGVQADRVDYAAKKRLPLFRRAYARNPNAVELALKKETVSETVYMADGLQVVVRARETGKKPNAVNGSLPGLAPTKATVKASEYSSSMKVYWNYKHNPSSADGSQKTIAPTKSFNKASAYSGRTRLTKNYRHNPMSDQDALKVIAPGRAYARITDYQGNVKMAKYNDKRFLPDAKFAHNRQNNVKQERTMMTDFKLLWTKIFKKNGTQPNAVKEKAVRPRYDKRERELWPGLYD